MEDHYKTCQLFYLYLSAYLELNEIIPFQQNLMHT